MEVTIDFVAFEDERDACVLALVEQGPWTRPLEDHLRALQERLYGCLEAALDGQLAERYPKAADKNIILRVHCYGLPRDDIDDFMERFSAGIRGMPDYSTASSRWVRSFEFEVDHDQIH